MILSSTRRASARRGNTLLLVLALVMLVVAELAIVHTYSSGNTRHLVKSNGHLRAIHIAESGFSQIIARLKGAPWSQRWFALAPASENDVPLLGGSYSSFVGDAPEPGRIADVWIESRFDTAVVVMFWRVRVGEPGLDFYAQVYPEFFTFLPADAPRPTPEANPLAGTVSDMIARQRTNAPGAIDLVRRLAPQGDFADVARTLGIPAGAPVLDLTPAAAGSPRPQSDYIRDTRPAAPLALPTPPPVLARPRDGEDGGGDGESDDEGKDDNEGSGEGTDRSGRRSGRGEDPR